MPRKKRFLIIFVLCYLLLISLSLNAQEAKNQIELSLENCISLALKSNLDINIQRINPQIQDTYLTSARGYFDPSLSFGPSVSKSNNPSSGTSSAASNGSSQGFILAFSDPIITGGGYGVSLNTSRFDSSSAGTAFINPSYRTGLTFSITQPLLKGFGIDLNKSSIYIAKNNKDISTLFLRSQLIRTLSDVQNTYWELFFAQENLKVQQLALKQAQDLLNINKRFKEEGKATISDVLQAQSAVASREADVIAAIDLIKGTEERLKRVTNIIQDESQWDLPIMLIDAPSIQEIDINLRESLNTAMKNRPEYLQAQLSLQNIDISIKLAKNQRLPTLDLEGSLSFNGFGDSGDTFSQVGKAEYNSWTAALALRVPIGGRVSKANELRSQLEKEQDLLNLADIEQQITEEVRNSTRQVEANKKRIEATSAAEEFAKQVLATEEKKYAVGLSTSYQLLQFQTNQTIATQNHLSAIIDYQKAIVNLYQSLGITLDKLNIKLEDERR